MHKAPGLLSSMQGVVGRDSTRAGEVTQWAEGLARKHQVLGLIPGIANKWCDNCRPGISALGARGQNDREFEVIPSSIVSS